MHQDWSILRTKMSEILLWKAGAKLVRKPGVTVWVWGVQMWKGLGASSGGASVSAGVDPGQMDREVSLTYESTVRTYLKAGLHRKDHCLPDTLELLPALPAWGLLANCTIYEFRESKILFHFNSQHQAQGLWATAALLQSVLRPSLIPVKAAPSSSCFYGTCTFVSPLPDCQTNSVGAAETPPTPGSRHPWGAHALGGPCLPISDQPTLTSPVAGTTLCSAHLHKTDEITWR